MQNYPGPKAQLDAAQAPDAPPEVLRMLAAESPYDFVQTAIAEHPKTEPGVLGGLVPLSLDSSPAQYLAVALACNRRTPADALGRLGDLVMPYLDNARGNQTRFEVGVALCCNPHTPFVVIARLLAPDQSATQFRKVVARESRRDDVLQLLENDRSETVRKQAAKTSRATV